MERVDTFEIPVGAGPHDLAPAVDGGVWFTVQDDGYPRHLDSASGRTTPGCRWVCRVPAGTG